MKAQNINNVINNLLKKDDIHAILISGTWGIGKTYNVEQFIKANKKKKELKIAYSSIFGKNSIDEINTELYQIFHPKTKIINLVTKVAKLINIGTSIGTGLNLNISGNFDKKSRQGLKRKKNIKSLIVLDDFERKSDKISSDELLGFINNLIIQGFKVVVLADLNTQYGRENVKYEISKIELEQEKTISKQYISQINWNDDLLGFYKEKVFDRIYEITESPRDVIKTIFGKDFSLLNEKIILEFDNNIRTAAKVDSLFKQICLYMEERKYDLSEKDIILKICLYTVKELMMPKYSKEFEKKNEQKNYLEYMENIFAYKVSKYDDTLSKRYELIEAVNNIYVNEDYSLLDKIYDPKQTDNLFESCFYASDTNKILQIKKQFDYIMKCPEHEKCNYSLINQFIRDWYNCCYYLDLSFIEKDKLFNKLNLLNFDLDALGSGYDTEVFLKIVDEYKIFRKKQKLNDIKTKLMTSNYTEIKNVLYDIYHSMLLSDNEAKLFITNLFKSHNFFLQNIAKDITPQEWETNHLICQIVKECMNEHKEDLHQVLLKIKKQNKDDKSCSERITSLIKQYDLKTKN